MSNRELIFLNYLSKVFENLDDAIILCELQNGVIEPVMANRGFYEGSGFKRTDDLKKIGESLAHQEATKAFLEKCYETLRRKENSLGETAVTLPVGERKFQVKLIPVLNSLGEPTHIVFIGRDVTELLELREKLKQTKKAAS